MNCSQCRAVLDFFIEGELDQHAAQETRAHIAVCASCAGGYEAILRERDALRQYLNEIDPSSNLWARVNHAIGQLKPARDRWFMRPLPGALKSLQARAGFASVVIVAVIWITVDTLRRMNTPRPERDKVVFHEQRPNSLTANAANASRADNRQGMSVISKRDNQRSQVQITTRARTRTTAKPELRQPTTDAIRIAERHYSVAIAQLTRDYIQHRKQLNPDAATKFEQTLAGLDVTIETTRRVAYADPNNPVAVQYLMTAYAAKVDALRNVIGA